MIEKCVDLITNWLINCDAVDNADKELYKYAIYSMLMSATPLLFALGLGTCFGCVKQCFIIILPFVVKYNFIDSFI